jgi:hypothetical protein
METDWHKGVKAGLERALYLCEIRKNSACKSEAFKAGCEDVAVFIAATLERLPEIPEGGSLAASCVVD